MDLKSLISQLQAAAVEVAKTGDEAQRLELHHAARDLSISIETPTETEFRLAWQVRTWFLLHLLPSQ